MLAWLQRFMAGRHGPDQLTLGLFVFYLILSLLARLLGFPWLFLLALALLVWACFRMLSRRGEKRSRENQMFLALLHPFREWIANFRQKKGSFAARRLDKKTSVYLKCPACSQQLRLPRGKGLLKARCPKCGHEFSVKT